MRFFKYRDRVLDTWVNQHWQFAESEFLQLPNVAARQIHIALHVEQDGSLINVALPFVTVTTLVSSAITTGFGLSAFLPGLLSPFPSCAFALGCFSLARGSLSVGREDAALRLIECLPGYLLFDQLI
ncbi:MAG: hypothetical protein MUF72_19760 [Elainella sp. Prado103]|nr:hypothetical protein [Elainella sp. Prado103]